MLRKTLRLGLETESMVEGNQSEIKAWM
ncbi:hypothetical protein AAFF_G00418640 [Aldrovandia affinis]|uniref:Uncharacterized protein n=1 Tax=Aldrovandia affinis TaxID=143900 RepID=A0AAD7R3I3_9TELE|nr:hypothetical protein AAFF_G00418640 [Aldrovandia affinis]